MERILAGAGAGATALRERGLGLADLTRRLFQHSNWGGRRMRIVLVCALATLLALGGGYLLVRHSRLSAVEHVSVAGASGPEAGQIEDALRSAASGMSTLGVNHGALSSAVARFHVVSALHLSAKFPHSLQITVSEQPAVAVLLVDGVKTAVAGNGIVLGPDLVTNSLPTIGGSVEPVPGRRLGGHTQLEALAVMAAAPPALAKLASRVYLAGQRGLTVAFKNGFLAYFGDATRPHAKWDSLAAVLSDAGSAGASYVDVRVPEHPAAGFPDGVAPDVPASVTGESESQQSSPQSPVSALAGALAAGAGISTTGTPTGAESATSGEHEESTTSGESEASTGTSETSETSEGTSAEASEEPHP
ncbi:MAG TPA: cell division protein FtsQ/DivIB [Solirubrobacteraceae bacterium]|jgi:cell division septal protein FtsQ